ncbi:MAG: alpha/beta fold hydrolase [Actinomycetota bacterium]|nr:alpha/beta fold hydrolase [Actinomycetota bacterium]
MSSSAIARHDVDVRGGRLAAFLFSAGGERGAGDSPAQALAVHGITATSRAWLAVARQLAGRGQLVAPDLRGRGCSRGLGAPYGMASHASDLLALLDHFELDRAVLVGHSLGAYIVARLAAEHPERVSALVLIDGGLSIPGIETVDSQRFVEAFLGPALARLRLTFASREAYRSWWRRHPAIAAGDIADADLIAYADHDLVGEEPNLRSSVSEPSVRGDAAELPEMGEPAHRLTVPARLLCAPRGLLNDLNPMQPLHVARAWAAEAPQLRRATSVPDVNHYTITMGHAGASVVADAIDQAFRQAAG